MSKWTHSICSSCYEELYNGRNPVKMQESEIKTCCFCGKETKEGIFVREHPEGLLCRGEHNETVIQN